MESLSPTLEGHILIDLILARPLGKTSCYKSISVSHNDVQYVLNFNLVRGSYESL